MAITKTKTVIAECDGPCGQKIQSEGIPLDWDAVKIERARYPNQQGVIVIKSRGTICSKCSMLLRILLERNGFKFQSANEQKNGSTK